MPCLAFSGIPLQKYQRPRRVWSQFGVLNRFKKAATSGTIAREIASYFGDEVGVVDEVAAGASRY